MRSDIHDSGEHNGLFTITYKQARQVYTEDWAIQSLDVVLGIVGGFTGLLWSALTVLLNGYESFKFDNTLIGALYPTSPAVVSKPKTEEEAQSIMLNAITGRGYYFYNYSAYICARIFRCLCCCCNSPHKYRWSAKLKQYEDASEQLANELDVIKLLKWQRISAFNA